MTTISKKNAALISSLYNRIFVAEMMLRDSEMNPESYKMWREYAVVSAQELDDKFGIKVVGY